MGIAAEHELKMRALALGILLTLVGSPVLACNICHSETATEVRHQVLHQDFARNAAAAAAPFPFLLGAVLLMARLPKRFRTEEILEHA